MCAGDVLDELISVQDGVAGGVGDDILDPNDMVSLPVPASTGTPDPVEFSPPTLLELSCQAVARHCSCATIEKHASLLDERLLRRVVYHSACIPHSLVGAGTNMFSTFPCVGMSVHQCTCVCVCVRATVCACLGESIPDQLAITF